MKFTILGACARWISSGEVVRPMELDLGIVFLCCHYSVLRLLSEQGESTD